MVIEVSQVTRDYGDVRAVDNLSFGVLAGEVYGLLGPNGAGKTTTLRMMAGLLTPTDGDIRVLGTSVGRDPLAVKASLGYLTSDTALYGRLTARETMLFFGQLNGRSKAWIADRTKALADDLGLHEFLDRKCGQLSSGQRQRVAIARALVHEPPVLVFDEPTATLDVVSGRFIIERLRQEAARGCAVVLSTHAMADAELICDRIGVLHKGKLLAEGTARDFQNQTQTNSLAEAFLSLVDRSGEA
jgi:sodium transport system ATP-binding protein